MKYPFYLSFILIITLSISAVNACICENIPINERFIASDIVLKAGIGSITCEGEFYKIEIATKQIHKGNPPKFIYMYHGFQLSSCDIKINPHEVWLIFLQNEDSSDRHYLVPCSGSRQLLAGELNMEFDSTLIFDTTVFRLGSPYFLNIDYSKGDSICTRSIYDSCSSILKPRNKSLIVFLTIYIDGQIELSSKQIHEITSVEKEQITAFLKDKKCHPFQLNGQYVSADIMVVKRKLPPTPR